MQCHVVRNTLLQTAFFGEFVDWVVFMGVVKIVALLVIFFLLEFKRAK